MRTSLLLFILFAQITAYCQSRNTGTKTASTTLDIGKMLEASGPIDRESENMKFYGKLIGSWDLEVSWFPKDGPVTRGKGEWHFGWILGGRGIQDVLFPSGASASDYGTSIRCYDKSIDAWHISFMMPVLGEFGYLIATRQGDQMVGEVMGLANSHKIKWTFMNVTDDSFLWRDEESLDFGKTWRTRQEMKGKRRG